METPAARGLARWHRVVEHRDVDELRDLLREDAVFRSPAVFRPQQGRDLVLTYLSAALLVLGDRFRYLDEWVRERDAVLEFTTDIDGMQVHGVDMIRFDDAGLIESFTVMVRPFKGLTVLMERMAAQLAALG